ncbi:MAG: ABC transporter ATP-binding protein [Bacillota bacterium]
MTVLLEMKQITKEFPGVLANDRIDLQIEKGEVHALLGENGAGKSTLMNILYGLYQPTKGDVYFKGHRVDIRSPRHAIDLGIGMVHQHFMLVPYLTVVENLVLGMKSEREPLLNLQKSAKLIEDLGKQYGMKIDPWAEVWQLSVGEQQRVEIIKALYRGAELLILDEPTAVLTPQEVEELFQVLKQLTKEGLTIIFISHKLNEVLAISDRVSVLRGGKKVATIDTEDATSNQLACLMVGREVLFRVEKNKNEPGRDILKIENLVVKNNKNLDAIRGLNLSVRQGEILGIAGVDGNGQSELAEAITGLRHIEKGCVQIDGIDITNKHPRDILECKVCHIPEDRQKQGLVMDMTVQENTFLQDFYRPPYANGIFLDWKYIKNYSKNLVKQYDVRCPNDETLARKLSGGNQQKVVLGREISRGPKLLVAMHPTRGLDVGAIEYVHKKIIEERDKGCAVLLISTELDEILFLADRIAVIYEGKIMGELINDDDVSIEEIGLMMAGTTKNQLQGKVS